MTSGVIWSLCLFDLSDEFPQVVERLERSHRVERKGFHRLNDGVDRRVVEQGELIHLFFRGLRTDHRTFGGVHHQGVQHGLRSLESRFRQTRQTCHVNSV